MAEEFDNQRPRRGGSYQRKQRFYRPRTCQFCTDKNLVINYKDTDLLRRFVHEDGKIRARRQSGSCAKHQRSLARAIKRARHIALLPFVGEVLR
ncbi:MAG: 30S ribosomal protein S18 [Anaerolineales bacterium]|nr:30S ribosomal protein S18 [Anaerolineales bacterium]